MIGSGDGSAKAPESERRWSLATNLVRNIRIESLTFIGDPSIARDFQGKITIF